MNLLTLIQAGFPPVGVGYYVRSTTRGLPRVSWHAVLAWRNDALEQAATLGAKWMWGGVDHFRPGAWEEGTRYLVARANEAGCKGIIVDPENGWPDISRTERRAQLSAFGAMLSDVGSDLSVGITSYPLFPDLETLASAAGSKCWGSPQIYGRSSHLQATATKSEEQVMAGWYARWQSYFGARLIPSVAAWDSGFLGNAEAYRRYLSILPKAQGAIAWPAGTAPAHIREGLEAYHPGGSAIGTIAIAAQNWVARPAGLAVLAVVAVVAVAITFAAVKV